jgi:hypothetical protein
MKAPGSCADFAIISLDEYNEEGGNAPMVGASAILVGHALQFGTCTLAPNEAYTNTTRFNLILKVL